MGAGSEGADAGDDERQSGAHGVVGGEGEWWVGNACGNACTKQWRPLTAGRKLGRVQSAIRSWMASPASETSRQSPHKV
jgi:hypothetical protein